MRRETQIGPDNDANHRALRRCCSCGSYARPYDEIDGMIRCQRCAQKIRRNADDEDQNTASASIVG